MNLYIDGAIFGAGAISGMGALIVLTLGILWILQEKEQKADYTKKINRFNKKI